MSSAASPPRHLANFLQRHDHALVILFFALLLPLLGFVKIAEEVFEKEPFAFEKPLMLAVHAGSSNLLSNLAVAFSLLGSAKGMAPLGLLLVAALYRVRRRLTYFVALSLGGVATVSVLLKNLFAPGPPSGPRSCPSPTSPFPAGTPYSPAPWQPPSSPSSGRCAGGCPP